MVKEKIFLALFMGCAISAQAQFSGKGVGTANDPYQVTTADELFEVRNDMSAYYKMMNDIDLTEWLQEESPRQGWMPIGNETTPFSGQFDGGNHVVRGLLISRPNSDNVGLFGYCLGANLKNCILVAPNITGKNYVGGIVGYIIVGNFSSVSVRNCQVINPIITGSSCIGGVIGQVTYYIENGRYGIEEYDYASTFEFNSVIDGEISGESVGGLIGRAGEGYYHYSNGSCSIQKNYSSCKIVSSVNAGGIVGIGVSYNGWRYCTINMNDNLSECKITSSNTCGGIVNGISEKCANVFHNIFQGRIFSTNNVMGIGETVPDNYNIFTFSKNFCIADSIASKSGKVYRIGLNASTDNYAYNGMIVYEKGKPASIEDSDVHGIGYGQRTLKKESTYVGAGFDFTDTWTIRDGETFPYLKAQTEPVTVTSFTGGSKATIKGSAEENGTIYVIVGDKTYESYIVDKQWELTLGMVAGGAEAKVYAMAQGKMPSIATYAKAEQPSSVMGSDANAAEYNNVQQRWFNLNGQSVSAGRKGFLIRQNIMSDGTRRNIKIINK